MTEPTPAIAAPRLGGTWSLRNLAQKARQQQISGNALMGLGLSVTVMALVLILWAGAVTGWPRVILLLAAAAILPVRLLVNLLGGMTLASGVGAVPTNSALRRWLTHWEGAILLVGTGFSTVQPGDRIGPMLGAVAGGLLLATSLRSRAHRAPQLSIRLYPSVLLAATCAISIFEPLWSWRGQTMLIGLGVISAILVVQILRPSRKAEPLAAG